MTARPSCWRKLKDVTSDTIRLRSNNTTCQVSSERKDFVPSQLCSQKCQFPAFHWYSMGTNMNWASPICTAPPFLNPVRWRFCVVVVFWDLAEGVRMNSPYSDQSENLDPERPKSNLLLNVSLVSKYLKARYLLTMFWLCNYGRKWERGLK